jgi:hypothetical protein
MLKACVPNVSSVFQKHVASVFILGVAIWILHMYYNGFSSIFSDIFANISDACFKCFICLQTYVANISSGSFKNRSECYTCCNGADGWQTVRLFKYDNIRANLGLFMYLCIKLSLQLSFVASWSVYSLIMYRSIFFI